MLHDSAINPAATAAHPLPSSPSASLTQQLYILPTLNLSVTLPISSSPCLGLFRCHSSSPSPSTHLSFAHSISANHSALSAPLLTASIDLHLLPVPRLPVLSHFSAYSSNSFFPSVASLHFIRLIISHHLFLSASVSLQLVTLQAAHIETGAHMNTHSLWCSHTLIL